MIIAPLEDQEVYRLRKAMTEVVSVLKHVKSRRAAGVDAEVDVEAALARWGTVL
jgi:hypothetical protein